MAPRLIIEVTFGVCVFAGGGEEADPATEETTENVPCFPGFAELLDCRVCAGWVLLCVVVRTKISRTTCANEGALPTSPDLSEDALLAEEQGDCGAVARFSMGKASIIWSMHRAEEMHTCCQTSENGQWIHGPRQAPESM